MSDDELQPIVDSINRSFLGDAKTLFELNRLFADLRARGRARSNRRQLRHPARRRSSSIRDRSRCSSARSSSRTAPASILASHVERLSRELTPDHVADGLDLALLATDARSFTSLWSHMNGSGSTRSLDPAVAEGLVAYARSNSTLGRELIDHLLDGTLFALADAIVPTTRPASAAKRPAGARSSIP